MQTYITASLRYNVLDGGKRTERSQHMGAGIFFLKMQKCTVKNAQKLLR